MNTILLQELEAPTETDLIWLGLKGSEGLPSQLSEAEATFVKEQWAKEIFTVEINRYSHRIWIVGMPEKKVTHQHLEAFRKVGHELNRLINQQKLTAIHLMGPQVTPEDVLATAEGILLSNYQFLKYFKDAEKRKHSLQHLTITDPRLTPGALQQLQAVVAGTCHGRTLVNEPFSFLTAVQMAEEFKIMSQEAGFKLEVLQKKQIEALQMGGLLAVNKGSIDPPTFSIMEWHPENPVNAQPIVLVGKGVVYDTGGLSLKPTPNSMDEMKCDMGGAAAVAGVLYATAKAKLPVHVIGLVPATDNRPSGNAYAPGDVISMHNGSTVEVMNTDAEGRLLLADALSYAQKYNPELVIDFATLTGAAVRAIGHYGIVSMGNATEAHQRLQESGERTYERMAPQPFWEEYAEELKSDIADLKNLGGPNAGAITAGKFLEHFTKNKEGKAAYPWLHLDIAGPAFLGFEDSYRGKWGTGAGIRPVFDFLQHRAG
ncbi:MAG: M17 family metallopeptidase [Salibacteraceae bacterium]